MNLRRLQYVAFACLAGAVGFTVFFFAAKHQPWLARVAPFGDDPYDAVGSFSVQLAGVAAVLSALRAVRRYSLDRVPDVQALLISRSVVVALLAVFVTVIADLVAMVRHPDIWAPSSAGRWLAMFLGVLGLATVGGVRIVLSAARAAKPSFHPPAWGRAAAITAAGALVLCLYPEGWRQSVPGAILTAIFGMALLFTEVWGLTVVLTPGDLGYYDDLLDDMHALFARGGAGATGEARERAADALRARPISQWLRAHQWRVVALVAGAGGLALALIETLGEGLPGAVRRALLLGGVITGIEALGILLGYALFWRLLGLLRKE